MSLFRPKEGSMTDMTVGNPYKLIFYFSIPLLIGNIFQQLYNMVDSIVVGQFIGDKALAAVGTGFPIIFMLSSLFMGIGMGATVMISQFYGADDLNSVSETINTMYTTLITIAIPLGIIGAFCANPLLRLMNVPDDGTLEQATIYVVVVFVGIIGMFGFNINAGILQGLGDSKSSLLFLLIASIINIVLDLGFVIVFHMGVFGVALATIIGQIASWIFGIFFLNKHYSFIHIKIFKFSFNKALFIKAMKLGIPSGIQQALFSVGIMVMQSLVNGYGSKFMAGFNGANKIDTFAFMPIQSFSNAITTYTGQNVGAHNLERVKHGTRAGLILTALCCIVLGGAVYPLSALFMRMFNGDPEVISAGVTYLHTVLPFYLLLGVWFIFSSVLRGAGETIIPMIASIVGLWLARIPAAYLFANTLGRDYIFYSYAVGWVFGTAITFISYCSGKWKKKSLV